MPPDCAAGGLNFEELRNYLPGDDTRNIDWKVTARTREPYIRVYTEGKRPHSLAAGGSEDIDVLRVAPEDEISCGCRSGRRLPPGGCCLRATGSGAIVFNDSRPESHSRRTAVRNGLSQILKCVIRHEPCPECQ